MIKKKGFLFVLIALIVSLAGLAATASGCGNRVPYEDAVAYYGCPNSRRVRKLLTRKTKEA